MKILAKLSNRMKSDVRFSGSVYRGHELSIPVNHQKLLLRCRNHELTVMPKALGTAFLIPALSQGRRLVMDSVDEVWYRNQEQVQKMVCDWWGYTPQPVQAKTIRQNTNPSVNQVGLAFSLGVDSMYSCFFADPRPNLLVLVGGFDVPWHSQKTINAMALSVRDIADELGMDWTVVETNLRKNYLFRRENWERTYGSAAAFIGLSLANYIDTMLISSGIYKDQLIPHGSHPDLDYLWGTSYLNIHHVGHDTTRIGKIEKIISDPVSRPIFKKYLRVCWENPSEEGNCGQCTKCILIKLSLLKLEANFCPDTMPNHQKIDEPLENIPPLLDPASLPYRKELLGINDAKINNALKKYILRSEIAINSRIKN